MKWPLDRVKELILLQELLHDAQGLNSGSGVIECMQRCISASKKLSQGCIDTGRPSFFQFIVEVRARDEGREK